eukprot:1145232-Pelagomonas_calceolata.AAC.2
MTHALEERKRELAEQVGHAGRDAEGRAIMGRDPLTQVSRASALREQELLAVVHALKIWRCYLKGPHFTVVTDHNPLVHLPSQPNLSGRQETWLPMPFAVAAHKTCSPVAAAMLMMLTRSESRPSPVTPASRSHHETSSEPICPLKARHVANSSLEGSLIPEGPEGTLDIYDEVRIGYKNDPWFKGEQHAANYTLKDGL